MGANNKDFGIGAFHARLGLLGSQPNDPRYAGPDAQTQEFEGSNVEETADENKFAGNANRRF